MGDSLKIGKAAATGKPAGIVAAVADAPAPEINSLVLVPPAPPVIVEEPQATNSIKLDAPTLAKLDRLVADYVVAISQLDTKDPKFESRIKDIRKLGEDDIKASAQVSSRLLDRPVGSVQKGGIAVTGTVATSLLQLRKQIDALNPGNQGDLFATRKIMGRVLPFGDRLRGYFAKYQSSQSQINAIVAGLERGQGELIKDNTDLEHEKENLWQTMERLRQYVYLAQKLDNSLTERIAKVEAKDPERAKILREDGQFYVRQKLQDLTAQLAVSVQGYLSIDVIHRNNLELVRGVDRATTTTVSALRTAVIV
ncbi:MAG TPA: toxic anion resistance protein, partial [Candidatus Limnocylindrales bacterium]